MLIALLMILKLPPASSDPSSIYSQALSPLSSHSHSHPDVDFIYFLYKTL